MFDHDFFQLLESNKINKLQVYLNKNPKILEELKERTSFLNSPSISERLYCIKYNIKSTPMCENKKELKYKKFGQGYGNFCSNSSKACVCRQSKIKNKKIKTNLEKYGTEWPSQNKKVKEKYRKTNLERYGVDNWAKTLESKKIKTSFWQTISSDKKANISTKRQITNLKKYGVLNPSQIENVKEKKKQTLLKNHGVEFFKQKDISKESLEILNNEQRFRELITRKTIKYIQNFLDVNATTVTNYCHRYGCRNLLKMDRSSKLEDAIKQICQENQITFLQNSRKIIPPMKLDFYFPESNSGIECHGLYWHSELAGNKNKDYHYNKWQECQKAGINLYQFFEDEFDNSFDIIKSKILYLNKKHPGRTIGAKHTYINWIKSYDDEIEFYNKNHIQGPRSDRTFTAGAYMNSIDLVACMSFKFNKNKNLLEIVRFATDIKNIYPGLFSKILNWSIKQINFKGAVSSWSDNRHSNGHLYKHNNFVHIQDQKAGYFVTDYETRWRREHFMKNKIKQRHPEVDLSKTEWQLEQELGYDRIWDAGKRLWIKHI